MDKQKISCGGFTLGNGLVQSKPASGGGKLPLQVNPGKLEYIRCKDISSNISIYKSYINLTPHEYAVSANINNGRLAVFDIENGVNCDGIFDNILIRVDEYTLQSGVLLDMSMDRMNDIGIGRQIFVGNTGNRDIYGLYMPKGQLGRKDVYSGTITYKFLETLVIVNDDYTYTIHGVTPIDVYASVMKFDEEDYSTVFNIITGAINNDIELFEEDKSTYTLLRTIEKDYKTNYFKFHFVNGIPTYVMDDKIVYSLDNGGNWIEVDAPTDGHCVQSRVYDGELWLCYENGEKLKVYKTKHPEIAELQTVIDLTQFEEVYPMYTNIGAHDGNVVVAVNTDNEHMYYIWSIDDGDTWFDGGEIRCQMSNNNEYIGVNNEGNMIWFTQTGEVKLFEKVVASKDGEHGMLTLSIYDDTENSGYVYYTGTLAPKYIINYYADGGRVAINNNNKVVFMDGCYYDSSTKYLYATFGLNTMKNQFAVVLGQVDDLSDVKIPLIAITE